MSNHTGLLYIQLYRLIDDKEQIMYELHSDFFDLEREIVEMIEEHIYDHISNKIGLENIKEINLQTEMYGAPLVDYQIITNVECDNPLIDFHMSLEYYYSYPLRLKIDI